MERGEEAELAACAKPQTFESPWDLRLPRRARLLGGRRGCSLVFSDEGLGSWAACYF